MRIRQLVSVTVTLLSAIALARTASAADRIRYVLFTAEGTKGGEQVTERRPDGSLHTRFVYKDNGRGPDLEEDARLADDGTYAEYRSRGTSMMGGPIDEKFGRKGDRASWTSTTERGEKRLSGPALYVPLNGSFEFYDRALAATAATGGRTSGGGKVPLLPSGTLTLRTIDETDVSRGGETRRVRLVIQTGQGLTPTFYWSTADEKPRTFAFIVPGAFAGIEEGWETNRIALEARQRKAEATYLADMAARLARPLPGLTVIRNARVFDSEHARLTDASDVYVLRGRISAVLPAGSPVRGADREIDAAGRVLLPGLFDMHAHSDRWDGALHLAAGVTTVRDMGSQNESLQETIDGRADGRLLGPKIVPAGFLEGESPYAAHGGFVIHDLAGAKDAIDWYAEHGYPQLKIYNSFPKEILRETVAYAHSRGMRVSGHVPAFLRAQDVVDAGFDEIQHVNQLMLNFFVTPTTDTRTLDRFYLVAEKTAGLDLDSKPVTDFVASLKAKPVVIDATVATFDFLRQRDGEIPKAYAAVFDHLPVDIQRAFRSGQMKIPDDATAARYEKSYAKMIDFVGRLYRAGVPLVAGTDGVPGFTLQRELELYVQAGLTPSQALQIATWNGALYSRTLPDRGSITPGKRADLVLFDGDPTKDIGDLRKAALVITEGRALSPADLDRELGIAPFVASTPEIRETAKAR